MAEKKQEVLAGIGFKGVASTAATIRSRPAWRLDLEKPETWRIWACRYYFIARGFVLYRLGFGTGDKAGMFPVFDSIAQNFAIATKMASSVWCRN
jgi:hypothetical protein